MPTKNYLKLHNACKTGNIREVNDLLAAGNSMNELAICPEYLDYTPLETVARYGQTELMQSLLSRQDVLRLVRKGSSLYVAAEYGQEEMVKLLLQYKADVNVEYVSVVPRVYTRPISIATVNGHDNIVRLLLDEQARTLEIYDHGNTLLHEAAAFENLVILQLLIDRQVDSVNATNEFGRTPLHAIANAKHRPDENPKRIPGLFKDSDSLSKNAERVVQILLQNKADINAQDQNGNTALHLAVNPGRLSLFDLDAGLTPVQVVKHKLGLIQQLVLGGIDPLITNKKGQKASDLSILPKVSTFLQEYEAKVLKEKKDLKEKRICSRLC